MTCGTGISHTLRILALLLEYPDSTRRAFYAELPDILAAENALDLTHQSRIEKLIAQFNQADGFELEARYIETFDRGRSTSLHLFEHVHGDSRARGPAMVDLVKTYEEAGLLIDEGELPDFLPVALEFASTQPPDKAREFLSEIAHILNRICNALSRRGSEYACIPAALLALAGEQVTAVDIPEEPALDESWEEPEAFAGCSSTGQAAPSLTTKAASLARRIPTMQVGADQ